MMKRALKLLLLLLPTLLAATARPVRAAGVHLTFVPVPMAVSPGDTFTVEVTVTPGDGQFNAFDLNIAYDPAHLAFVPTSPVSAQRGALMTSACSNTFHLFTPTPGLLSATLSLLCNNVFVTGPGVIYKVRFAATDSVGPTTVSCAIGTQFYRAGFFVNPLDCQPLTLDVGGVSAVPDAGGRGAPLMAAPWPNPRRGSIEPVQIAFRLPQEDEVRLEIFDTVGRRVAARPAGLYPAGDHEIRWDLPALGSGLYFIRLTTATGLSARRRWVVVR